MDTLLLILTLVLLAVAAGLAVGLVRRTRQVTTLLAEQARRESERDEAVAQQVRRQVRREERRVEREAAQRRQEIERRERDVSHRQTELTKMRARLDQRAQSLDDKAEELSERTGALDAREGLIAEQEAEVDALRVAERARLEEVAALTTDQARERLLAQVDEEIQGEVARLIQKADEAARIKVDETARQLVLEALSSLRGSVAGEGTVAVVPLPSDEMKGRVIGREGRNIRALEQATGVDLLVDDTPEAILISTWDPLRRTIAARAVRKLVEDGRIHPARIEEVVERTREEADIEAREIGETAAFEVGVTGLHERLVLLLGRLSFHTDHGHSLLDRGREVALIAGAIADDMRLDGEPVRRAGLLHEVVRAEKNPFTNHYAMGSAELATRFGEATLVANTIRALAQPPDAPRTPQGVVLVTARRMAVSRPGARNDNLQRYMDRLRTAEEIALGHDGIEHAFAVRAGRELRVHVRADSFRDEQTIRLARQLAKEIESSVDYPGQIRVLVLRETRAVSYAV
jgi:ribonuclease Y